MTSYRQILMAAACGAAATTSASAAVQYFSYDAARTSWTGNFWATASAGSYANAWGGYNEAVLEGAGGTVTAGGAVNKWTFNSDGYVLSGGFTQGSPAAANLIVSNAAHTGTISGGLGVANGANILWKDGPGKLVLSGGNSAYKVIAEQGTLEMTGGSLTVTANSSSASAKGFFIGRDSGTTTKLGTMLVSGGTLTVNGGNMILGQVTNAATKVSQFTQTGGTVTVNGNVLFANGGGVSQMDLSGGTFTANSISKGSPSGTATLNVDGGTLKAATNSTTFLAGLTAVNLKAGGAAIDTNNFDITIGQALLADGGGLTKNGAGTLTLSGVSTYAGATTVNAGTLAFSGAGSIAASTLIDLGAAATLQGGTFGSGQTIRGTGKLDGAIAMGAGAVLAPAGDAAMGAMEVTGTLTLSGSVHMQIQKTGGALSGDQFTGVGAVIFGGTLVVEASGEALTAGDSIQLFANTGGLGGGFAAVSLPALPGGLAWNYGTLATDGRITVGNALSSPLFSPVGGSYLGSQSVTITGDVGSTIYYTMDGSTPTDGSPHAASPITNLTVPVDGTTIVKAFARKSGVGDSPVATASYVTLSIARWNVDNDGSWSEGAKWLSGVVPDGSGAVVDFHTTPQSFSTTITLDSNRTVGGITFGNSNPIDWSLNATGGNTLTLAAAGTPALTVQGATIATINAPILGTQGLTKLGTGTLTLSGANSYSGATSVTEGTLKLGAANVLPDAYSLTLASGTTFDMGGRAETIPYLAGAGNVMNNGGLTLDLGGAAPTTFTGSITGSVSSLAIRGGNGGTGTQVLNLSAPSSVSNLTLVGTGVAALELAGGDLSLTGSVIANNTAGNALLTVSGGSLTSAGPDFLLGNGGGNCELLQTGGAIVHNGGFMGLANFGGTSTLNISGGSFTSTASGINMGVRGSAVLNLSGNAVVEAPTVRCFWSDGVTGTGKSVALNLNGGTLITGQIFRASNVNDSVVNFNGGTLKARAANGAFIGVSTANVKAGGAVIDTNSFNVTIGQALLEDAGSTGGGLTKSSGGTLTLAAANTYTGATAVNGGVLLVNGSTHAASAVAVGATATLGGTGNAAGTITAAGIIAPGTTGTGTLATGAATLTGTYACQVDGSTADRWNVSGDLKLEGASLVVSEINSATFTSVVIATYTGDLIGTFGSPALPSGMSLQVDTTAKEIRLVRGGDFDSWLGGFTFAPGADTSPGGDADGDGMSNQQEYSFGLNPSSGGSCNPITSLLDKTNASFTYTRRKPSLTGLSYRVWTSPDLATWTEDTGAVQTPTDQGDNQSVVVTLSATAPLAATKLFVRCTAE